MGVCALLLLLLPPPMLSFALILALGAAGLRGVGCGSPMPPPDSLSSSSAHACAACASRHKGTTLTTRAALTSMGDAAAAAAAAAASAAPAPSSSPLLHPKAQEGSLRPVGKARGSGGAPPGRCSTASSVVCSQLGSPNAHTHTLPSSVPAITQSPLGEKARALTVAQGARSTKVGGGEVVLLALALALALLALGLAPPRLSAEEAREEGGAGRGCCCCACASARGTRRGPVHTPTMLHPGAVSQQALALALLGGCSVPPAAQATPCAQDCRRAGGVGL